MQQYFPVVARTFPVVAAAASNHQPAWTARCAAMHVTRVAQMQHAGTACRQDKIEVLIPGEEAPLRATFPKPDGHAQQVCVREPYVSVIPAHQPHEIDCEPQSDGIVIALSQTFFEKKAAEALGSASPILIERVSILDPFISEIGNELRGEFRAGRVPDRVYLESLAAVISIHLARKFCGQPAAMSSSAGLPFHKLARVRTFIRDHLTEPIHVQQLAATVHLSTFHFARMFRRTTGQPPHIYITRRRVEHAKELLSASAIPLVDVAASVGFQTQSHFTGVFHRYTGMTPRLFRLSCREPCADSSSN